jgi:hypothetical protein
MSAPCSTGSPFSPVALSARHTWNPVPAVPIHATEPFEFSASARTRTPWACVAWTRSPVFRSVTNTVSSSTPARHSWLT